MGDKVRVILLAQTVPNMEGLKEIGYQPHEKTEEWEEPIDELHEAAGRVCYKSWNRPNPATATNSGYLRNIIDSEHYSVLGHASATFYFDGISRSLTHELIRHKWFTYSQVSQRYVNESNYNFVIPPDLRDLLDEEMAESPFEGVISPTVRDVLNNVVHETSYAYENLAIFLENQGFTRKRARSAARSVLPNGAETAIIVSGNMWAWRGFLKQRMYEGADEEIQELASNVLINLKRIAPNTFQDM